MNINSIGGAGAQSAPAGAKARQGMDARSNNIRQQIEDAQRKLQEISADGEMSPEEKMKKRQEIQKQISDLNMQLQQHQANLRRQQQEEKRTAKSQGGGDRNPEEQTAGFSPAGMAAVISADSSMKQARVQNSVAVKMEGRAGVLEAEIKQDGKTGGAVQAKEEELAGARQKADEAKASGMETLKEANREMREASEAERDAGTEETRVKTDREHTEEEKEEEKAEQTDMSGKKADDGTRKEPGMYVDVRL